MAHGGLD